jgi:tRNA dimethylallyltransferase
MTHHLIDVVEPDQVFTAGDYSRLARAAIAGIASRGKLPIVVGGTGFYLRALLAGLFEGPPRDEALRRCLAERERRRDGSLHRLLGRLDPAAAARIHANDKNKLIRSLEVILTTRRPLTELFAERRDPLTGYRVLKIGLNPGREELYRRIDERSALLYQQGLVEETRAILAMGYHETCKPFQSLGYAEAIRVIHGKLGLDEAIAATALATRQYAKRQWTWFRGEKDVHWLDGFGGDANVERAAIGLLHAQDGIAPGRAK